VGRATVVGGVPRQLHILIDPDKLNAYNIGIGQVISAVQQENQDLPAGSVTQNTQTLSIQVEGRINSIEGFENIIVTRQAGQPVYLSDVATVEMGQADITSMALLNGEPGLAIDVVQTQ